MGSIAIIMACCRVTILHQLSDTCSSTQYVARKMRVAVRAMTCRTSSFGGKERIEEDDRRKRTLSYLSDKR
jgi:hypothetical protein